jgi:hypothetical protein
MNRRSRTSRTRSGTAMLSSADSGSKSIGSFWPRCAGLRLQKSLRYSCSDTPGSFAAGSGAVASSCSVA